MPNQQGRLERLMFSRVDVWAVLAIVLIGLLGALGFGMLVFDNYAGPKRFGVLSGTAGYLASLPEQSLRRLKNGNPKRALITSRFDEAGGWSVSPGSALEGYLLLSRHDGDLGEHRIDLVDLSTLETLHTWLPEPDALYAAGRIPGDDDAMARSRIRRFRAIHPLPFEDGGLLIKDHGSPLFRIDACSNLVWANFDIEFHHSSEWAPEGGIWIPINASPEALGLHTAENFIDTSMARVSRGGQIVQRISLARALLKEGLMPHFLTPKVGGKIRDPMHLNDIEPVLEDGPYWRRGDLFLSMRHMSMVALYRPSEDRIVWYKRGPWLAQHDVDILDDSRISIFSNNAYDAGDGIYVYGTSQVMIYDFANDSVTLPYEAALEALDMKTSSEGLADLMPGGDLFVEEENSGRIVIVSADNEWLATYLNRAEDGEIYRLGWSRYLDAEAGGRLREALKSASCDG